MHLRKINMKRARKTICNIKYKNVLYLEIRNRRNALICRKVSWYASSDYLIAS